MLTSFTFVCVCACAFPTEVPLACEGDVCVVPEDGVPSGEAGGQPADLPQRLLPLHSLQHQTQVGRCCSPNIQHFKKKI